MATQPTNAAKDAIFFAHSFDSDPPPWSSRSDAEVTAWFQKLLVKRWRVISGKGPEARSISAKVVDAVNESKALVALFTRRHEIVSPPGGFITSPWLISECALALGMFRYHNNHIIAGFREKGIDPKSLGILSSKDMEFPEFDRDHLDRDRSRFNKYLDDLESRIRLGPTGQAIIDPDIYIQARVHKIYLIYRNGFGTVHNIVDIAIRDAARFMDELHCSVPHRIWTHFGNLPALDEMLAVPVHMRKNKAFFHGILESHQSENIRSRLQINESSRRGNSVRLSIQLRDKAGQPLRVKVNDTIRYQYAWGLPNMFPVNEEQLPEVVGDRVDSKSYCLAELDANYGEIYRAKLELRFEREAHDSHDRHLFSKSPFVRFGTGPAGDTDWGPPRTVLSMNGDPDEFDMWYERYIVELTDFRKRMAVAWRPSRSRAEAR